MAAKERADGAPVLARTDYTKWTVGHVFKAGKQRVEIVACPECGLPGARIYLDSGRFGKSYSPSIVHAAEVVERTAPGAPTTIAGVQSAPMRWLEAVPTHYCTVKEKA